MQQTSILNVSAFLSAMHLESFQKISNFHVLKFEDHFEEMPKKFALFSEGYFEITLVTQSSSGSAKLKVEGTEFRPLANHFTFVAPGQSTYVDVQGDITDGRGFLMVFSSDFLETSFSDFNLIRDYPFFNTQISPVYSITEEKEMLFLNLINTLYEKFRADAIGNKKIIQAYLNVLLLEIKDMAREYKHPVQGRREEVTFMFENMIKQTESKHQSLSYYASQLNISTVYLSECVKRATGMSAKQIIDQYIVLEAKSLLSFSSLNIGEIAFKLGFEDRSNFINFFKKKTGMAPRYFKLYNP